MTIEPSEFLSKDRDKALYQIKAQLYMRMDYVRDLIEQESPAPEDQDGQDLDYIEGWNSSARQEIHFIREILDLIERS